MSAPGVFRLLERRPHPRLAGLVSRLIGYCELAPGTFSQLEPASLVIPFVASFGAPWQIGLGGAAGESRESFVAGLYAGHVTIASDGAAACVQADLTPLGACRLLGGAVREVAARLVDLGELFGLDGRYLVERVARAPGWRERIDLVEAFLLARLVRGQPAAPEIAFALSALARSRGTVGITALAREIGWSRKTLTMRFHHTLGLPPKPVARILRFQHAARQGRAGTPDWAEIALEAGYADQAHLTREFRALAGMPPERWRRSLGADRPPA